MAESREPINDWTREECHLYSESNPADGVIGGTPGKEAPKGKEEIELGRVRAALGATVSHYEVVDDGLVYAIMGRIKQPGSKIVYDGVAMFIDMKERYVITPFTAVFGKDNKFLLRLLAQYSLSFDKKRYDDLVVKYDVGAK